MASLSLICLAANRPVPASGVDLRTTLIRSICCAISPNDGRQASNGNGQRFVNRREAKGEGGVRGLCRARNTQPLALDSEKSFASWEGAPHDAVVSIMRLCNVQKSTVVFHCLDRVWTSPVFPTTCLSLGSARRARLESSLSQSSLVTNERESTPARLYNARPKSLKQEESCFCAYFSHPLLLQGHRALSKSYQGIPRPAKMTEIRLELTLLRS
jgi:hypothetical protein